MEAQTLVVGDVLASHTSAALQLTVQIYCDLAGPLAQFGIHADATTTCETVRGHYDHLCQVQTLVPLHRINKQGDLILCKRWLSIAELEESPELCILVESAAIRLNGWRKSIELVAT